MEMDKLTIREEWVLKYLQQHYEANKDLNDGFCSPTDVGRAYGFFVLGKHECHSSTGSPILKSLVNKGYAERNGRGHYRLLNTKTYENT